MLNTRGLFFTYLCSLFLTTTAHAKPKPIVAPADVVARVHATHAIFISGPSGMVFHGQPYLALYQAISAWPGVQIVDSPLHADLVFQAWGTETDFYSMVGTGARATSPKPSFRTVDDQTLYINFQIIDPNGGAVLWSISTPIDNSSAKALAQVLLSLEPLIPAPKPVKISGPLPSQIRLGNKAYLQPATYDAGSVPPLPGIDDVIAQTVKASGLYTFVDSPASAEVILAPLVKLYPPLGRTVPEGWPGYLNLRALDPSTQTLLWSNSNSLVTGPGIKFSTANKLSIIDRLRQTMPYVVKDWKQIITTKAIPK